MNLITNTWPQSITTLTLSCRDVKWIAPLFGCLLKRILPTKKREPCIIFSFFTLLRIYLTSSTHSVSQLCMWTSCRIRDWVLKLEYYQHIFHLKKKKQTVTKLLRPMTQPQDWIWFCRLITSTNGFYECFLDLKNQIYMLSGDLNVKTLEEYLRD